MATGSFHLPDIRLIPPLHPVLLDTVVSVVFLKHTSHRVPCNRESCQSSPYTSEWNPILWWSMRKPVMFSSVLSFTSSALLGLPVLSLAFAHTEFPQLCYIMLSLEAEFWGFCLDCIVFLSSGPQGHHSNAVFGKDWEDKFETTGRQETARWISFQYKNAFNPWPTNYTSSPGWCGSVDWAATCEPKSCQFDSQSGHMPGLWATSPVGAMWDATTYWCFSPSHSLSLPLSLKINK